VSHFFESKFMWAKGRDFFERSVFYSKRAGLMAGLFPAGQDHKHEPIG